LQDSSSRAGTFQTIRRATNDIRLLDAEWLITVDDGIEGSRGRMARMDGFGKKTWHVAITDRHNSRRG
jgi:hypothetical protein